MKTLTILFLLLCSARVFAGEQDQKLVILSALASIDYSQSAGWVTPGGGAMEINPLLGTHPTRAKMAAFGCTGMGLVWLATKILPEKWGAVILRSAISSEQWNIEDNVLVQNRYSRRINATPIIITLQW